VKTMPGKRGCNKPLILGRELSEQGGVGGHLHSRGNMCKTAEKVKVDGNPDTTGPNDMERSVKDLNSGRILKWNQHNLRTPPTKKNHLDWGHVCNEGGVLRHQYSRALNTD